MLLLRESRLINDLLRATRSEWGGFYRQDDLARVLGGLFWHRDRAWRRRVAHLEPVLSALGPANEIYERIWDARPRTAFALPESLWGDSLIYMHFARLIDCHHVALYPYLSDGEGELVLLLVRGQAGRPYGARELRAMEEAEARCERHA